MLCMKALARDPFTWIYPEIEPFNSGMLKVSDTHTIYYEESGNPQGKPVLFVHGGPGAGTDAKHRRFFDPRRYRIVLFDQRGCGKSTPHASTEENTTWNLVSDMEMIRQLLSIEKWQIFGGSWGSTLGLAYAQKHPERVSELVLRGIFLMRKKEIDWLYQYGACEIFPDAWERYRDFIPPAERSDFLQAYNRRLMGQDKHEQLSAARIWSSWEAAASKLFPEPDFVKHYEEDKFALAFARMESHYFVNKGFLEHDDQLLREAAKLKGIPGVIVHGRYDVVCPVDNAFALHKVWPEAQLTIVPDAGHSAFEPGIARALCAATDKFA